MIYPNFVGPSYTSQSPNADAEVCMNWYPEVLESAGAKVRYALYPTPGLTTFGSVAQSPVRGLFATGELVNRVFAVIGFKLYEFSSAGAATDRGTVDRDQYPATFAYGGAASGQMLITSGGSLYVYDLGANTLTKIVAFSGAGIPIRSVSFLDGYFLALDAVNSAMYVSAFEDGATWDVTQVAQRQAGADPWIAMAVIAREIWLMGTLTSEVWYNAGTSPFPFAPIPGAFLEQGCAAGFSLNNLDSTLVWLGANSNGRGVVWRSNGYRPVRISTHAVEFAIQGYTVIDDAVSFSYQDQGHGFFVITFPTEDVTWVYDTATGLWHQRGYWSSMSDQFSAYRPLYHCSAFGQHVVGDRALGRLYTMSISVATDADGAVIRRVRRAPHLSEEQKWVFYPGLQVDLQTGVGTVGMTTAPQVMLSWSDDGGLSFPTEIMCGAGLIGQTQARARFFPLGRSRDRVFQVAVSDPVPWRMLQAILWPDPIVGTA